MADGSESLPAPVREALGKARKTPELLTYEEFCWLLETFGWEKSRTFEDNGLIWIESKHGMPLTTEPSKLGNARVRQVLTFLSILDATR